MGAAFSKGAKGREAIGEQKAPADLVADVLGVIERDWYPGQRDVFFRDRKDLVRWITWPAWFLENRMGERYAPLPWVRYQDLVLGILRTMAVHGRQAPRYFPRYFGRAVQTHMEKHWEEYADEVRAIRARVDRELARAQVVSAVGQRDQTVERLVEVHRAVSTKGGRKRKADKVSAAIQGDLFGV